MADHTYSLLGTTIGYSPADWAEPTRLPGWTRSHIAAHLILGARGLLRVLQGGPGTYLYDSSHARARDIELGALCGGMELQVELDTTAGELQSVLPELNHAALQPLFPGDSTRLCDIPLLRLRELVLHSFDLEPDAASDLVVAPDLAVSLLGSLPQPSVGLANEPTIVARADEGLEVVLPGIGDPMWVSGPARCLVTWITRRVGSHALRFADAPSSQDI
ncbi:MAG: maleylpyruvate isomerase family mycothiol-dependent enzyme [Arachnia sp.]